MAEKTKSEFKHLLITSLDLSKQIEEAQKKYRPFYKSRNSFICELISLGIAKLSEQEK
jgi:hypothetical protein